METMKTLQSEFLKILESFMHDKPYRLPEDFRELVELFKLSQEHQVAPVVYEKIRTESIWRNAEYQNLAMIWKRSAVRDVMMQMQREDGFLAVYEKLCKAGVEPLVVKGLICRNMYSQPDYRISGDEDMLVCREDFAICDEVLLKEGFLRQELDMEKLPYEVPYRNPRNGVYIELHFTLFAEESGAYGHLNDEFQEVFEHSVCAEIKGKQVWTLCPTEHLFYLICHSFKHFLHGGFGLRQVCDMVQMAERDGEQIDWYDIRERLTRLNMSMYWDALVGIGKEFFAFSMEKASYPQDMQRIEVDYGPMLADLLDSGIYGGSTDERKHSSNMTLAAVQSGKKNTAASLRASLFPGFEYMKGQFGWLKKYPWLLPIAYGIRMVRYLKASKKRKAEGQNSVQIGMDRVELLRTYHIIE